MLHFNGRRGSEGVEDQLAITSAITTTTTADAPTSIGAETSVWKVLVLDSAGQRILSPIMKVNDLRDHGVTLYLYHT